MPFEGWPADAIAFYVGLEADNSKPYWTAHRAVFDTAVHAPMAALVEELEPRYGPGRVMRPYRDIRFSRDKSPYKTALGATVGDAYVQISARGLGVGGGLYHLAPDQLARYRDAVDAAESGEALVRAAGAVEAAGVDVIGVDSLKTAPRGFAADHPRIALLRHKGLVAWREWPIEPWLATAGAKDRVVEALEAAAPLVEWLRTHVGPTTDAAVRAGRRRP